MTDSAATGVWTSPGSWAGGVVPGNGDLAVILTGHTITVDANTIIGDSPAGGGATRALKFNAPTAALVIDDEVMLQVRGDLEMTGNGTKRNQITMNPGSILEMDASQASSPTSQHYRIIVATGNTQFAKIKVNGTQAKPATIRSNSSGGNAHFDRNGFIAGPFESDWLLLQHMGTSSQDAFYFYLGNSSSQEMRMRDTVIDACGRFRADTTPNGSAQLEFTRVTTKNSLHSTTILDLPPGPSTTKGILADCSFDKRCRLINCANWQITGSDGNVFVDPEFVGTTRFDKLEKFLVYRTQQAPMGIPAGPAFTDGLSRSFGTCDDAIFWKGAVGNPHTISPAGNTNQLYRKCWFGYDGTDTVGDCINIQAASGPRIIRSERCVLGANVNGAQQGKFMSLLGAGNKCEVDRTTAVCSAHANERGLVQFGESYAGADGEVGPITNSLAISPSGNNAIILSRGPVNTTTLTNPTDFHHNATYQGLSGSDGVGYDATSGTIFSGGSPGANDIQLSADPCVDILRTIASWDALLGGPGTTSNALAELRKRYDFTETPDPNYTLAALRAYLWGGADVTDAALNGTGDGGVTRGAGDFVGGGGGGNDITLVADTGVFTTVGHPAILSITPAPGFPGGGGSTPIGHAPRGHIMASVTTPTGGYKDLADFGFALERTEGLFGRDVNQPTAPLLGEDQNAVLSEALTGLPRSATIEGWVGAADPAELIVAIRKLVGWLDRTVALKTKHDDLTTFLKVNKVIAPPTPARVEGQVPSAVQESADVLIQVTAEDPRWYSVDEEVLSITTNTALALGEAVVQPVIRATGAFSNLTLVLRNHLGVAVLTTVINVSLPGAADWVEIDCANKTITKSIAGVITGDPTAMVSGDFVDLDPRLADMEAEVWPTMSRTLGSGSAAVTCRYRKAWY